MPMWSPMTLEEPVTIAFETTILKETCGLDDLYEE